MAPQQVCCQVCGGPILSRPVKLMDNTPEVSDKIDRISRNNHNTWLGEAVALTTGYRTQDGVEVDTYYPLNLDVCGFGLDSRQSAKDTDRVVLRFDASYDFDLGPRFQLSRWDEEVELNSLSVCGSLYLPAHDACMRLADRFVDSTSTPDRAENKNQDPGTGRPDDETLQLPPSLRNRRRIWRILEEARVGDLSTSRKSNPLDMSRLKRNMHFGTSSISLPPSSAINPSSLVKSTSSFRTASRNGIVLRFPPRPHRPGFT
ncbi:hypothetical protein D6C92_00321 [Aureobasidium pullulans]|nr:hypothetical protein D6C92_00321 [Aureobasidium pullulans]TIA06776.1 hypothetical protein D6C81_09754 [Aureobasidium pullulans]